jgi:competence protein ComEC
MFLMGALWAAQRELNLRNAPLRVTMLDVGQGEAIVIQAPSGRTVLIDGGSNDQPDVGRSIIVPYLQFIGARRVDAVVFTHADSDHCNGIEQVVREMPIGMALDGAVQPQTLSAEYQIAKLALKRASVPIFRARAGQKLNLGGGVWLTVLAPTTPPLYESPDNNNAVVLRLDYGQTNFLFTADIQEEAEERLLRRGAAIDCTILKVAHHGSKSSTTESFLRRAHPQAAIVSCGRYNRFGHPAPQTLKSLARRAIPVFRTDLNGAIEITSDGRACNVQTYR